MTSGKFRVKKNYANMLDLDKVDSFEFFEEEEQSSDNKKDNHEKVSYTCQTQKCKIPCPCAPCCTSSGQCSKHKVKHMKLFDDKKHSFVVRSTEEFCRNDSFFHNSYIMKYVGIPLDCLNCKKDLLHHKSYHISYHDACKFCVQNWYKMSANNVKEFHEMESKEMHYLRSVCPYCDKRFC
jgi:hypothetical protein